MSEKAAQDAFNEMVKELGVLAGVLLAIGLKGISYGMQMIEAGGALRMLGQEYLVSFGLAGAPLGISGILLGSTCESAGRLVALSGAASVAAAGKAWEMRWELYLDQDKIMEDLRQNW